jgi:GTP cyclohydrolase II
VPSRDQNIRYLQTKKDRMEHRLTLDTHVVGAHGAAESFPPETFQHEQD